MQKWLEGDQEAVGLARVTLVRFTDNMSHISRCQTKYKVQLTLAEKLSYSNFPQCKNSKNINQYATQYATFAVLRSVNHFSLLSSSHMSFLPFPISQ